MIGGVREGRPGQREVTRRHNAGLRPGASCGEGDRAPELVTSREQPEDLGARGAEGAVSGAVLRKRRRWEGLGLVGEPVCTVDQLRTSIWASPGEHLLSSEEVTQGGDGPDRRERTLVVQQQMLASSIPVGRAKEGFAFWSKPTSPAPGLFLPEADCREESPV